MDARMVDWPGAHVLGLMARINPMRADYNDLWANKYTPYVEDESRPSFEEYEPEMTGPDSPVTVYVAIKLRQ